MTTSRLSQSKTKSPSEVRLVEVLDAYMAAAQEGRAPARDELLAQHPELAEDLEACLASLEFIRQASLTATPLLADSKAAEISEGEPGIGDLGDFRLIAEVGRGGMGVVYEAVQRSLNRRVALKVLPFAAAMDPTQLRRFQTEALAAAQLHHTHIVPVYSVGCERGVHYYAMQFIEGQTLAQAIAERRRMEETSPPPASRASADPADPGEPARRGSPDPAAGARRGSPDPAAGARRGSPDPAETPAGARRGSPDPAETADRRSPIPDESPTPRNVTGSATPSPTSRSREYLRTAAALGIQAADALDHAHKVGIVHRDIKPANLLLDIQGSLWVTDFGLARLQDDAGLTITGDLLGTLRYMSPEQALAKRGYLDHRTDIYSLGATLYELVTLHPAIEGQDRQEVLRKIAQDDPTPPRRLNPAIPRELETILLKAMNKEPGSRYDTAQELADDLRRFLDDKPIKAKRPTVWKHVAKWSRRHRTAVTAAVVILILATAALGASTVLIARERAQVVRQRDRARKAVDEMYTEVAQKWLSQQPQLEPLQREFLLKALAFYQEFARERGTDPAARHGAARAERNAGDILRKLGEHSGAENAYRRAVEIEEVLVAGFPKVPDYRTELANDCANLALSLRDTGRLAEAEHTGNRALELRETLAADFPNVPDYRRGVALSYDGLGIMLRERSRFVEAERSIRRAIALQEALVTELPKVPGIREDLASYCTNLGNLFFQMDNSAEAERAWNRAIELQEAVSAEFPEFSKASQYRQNLAFNHSNLGALFSRVRSRFVEAERALRRSLDLRESLVAEFPRVPEYRRDLADTYANLGALLGRVPGRLAEAEGALRKGIELQEVLVAQSPDVPAYRSRLGASLNNLGSIQQVRGELAAALSSYQRAIEHQRGALRANSNDPTYREYLRNHYGGLVDVSRKRGDHTGAAHAAEEYAQVSPHPARDAVIAAGALVRCEQLAETDSRLSIADRQAKVREYSDRAAALLKNGAEAAGDDPEALNDLAWFLATCPDSRLRDRARAVELARKAIVRAPKAGAAWNTLGVAHYRAGAWNEAIEALLRSTELTSGGSPGDWFFLAMAYCQKGEKDKARSWYEKAVNGMEKNKSQDEELRRFRAEATALLRVTEHPKSTGKKEEQTPRRSKP